MKGNFDRWKEDLEGRASDISEPKDNAPEPSPEEINKAVYDTAGQMDDAESLKLGDRPIEVTIKELEAEGWHYRGPVSSGEIFELVAEDGKEIQIVGTGTEKFLFEKEAEGGA